jgi:Na+/glutamate symporter
MNKFWRGMMTGGILGGALGAYLLSKRKQEQEEMLDTAMENTSGMARHTARVIGRSAAKMGTKVVRAGQSAVNSVRRSGVRN